MSLSTILEKIIEVYTMIFESLIKSYMNTNNKKAFFTEKERSLIIKAVLFIPFFVIALYTINMYIYQWDIYLDQITTILSVVASSFIALFFTLFLLYFNKSSEEESVKNLMILIFKSSIATLLLFALFELSNVSPEFFSYVKIEMFRDCFIAEIGSSLFIYFNCKYKIIKRIKSITHG